MIQLFWRANELTLYILHFTLPTRGPYAARLLPVASAHQPTAQLRLTKAIDARSRRAQRSLITPTKTPSRPSAVISRVRERRAASTAFRFRAGSRLGAGSGGTRRSSRGSPRRACRSDTPLRRGGGRNRRALDSASRPLPPSDRRQDQAVLLLEGFLGWVIMGPTDRTRQASQTDRTPCLPNEMNPCASSRTHRHSCPCAGPRRPSGSTEY